MSDVLSGREEGIVEKTHFCSLDVLISRRPCCARPSLACTVPVQHSRCCAKVCPESSNQTGNSHQSDAPAAPEAQKAQTAQALIVPPYYHTIQVNRLALMASSVFLRHSLAESKHCPPSPFRVQLATSFTLPTSTIRHRTARVVQLTLKGQVCPSINSFTPTTLLPHHPHAAPPSPTSATHSHRYSPREGPATYGGHRAPP
jgi:hypothetical protein